MDDRQARHHPLVGKVPVVSEELRRQEHALVADGPARHGKDVEVDGRVAQFLADEPLGPLARQVQGAFQVLSASSAAVDECLADERLGLQCELSEDGTVVRHVAPPQQGEPVVAGGCGKQLLAPGADRPVGRGEYHRQAVRSVARQRNAATRRLGGEELVRNSEQYSRAVPGRLVAAGSASVLKVQ
jgi:hypothetical protein